MNITETIKNLLSEAINKPSDIEVEDVTHKHLKHKSHESGKYHIKLTIHSDELASMTKIAAHRKIYQALDSLMTEQIHSLIIQINKTTD